MNNLLGIEEAATKLGISQWTLRYFVRLKKIASIKIGRRVLIEEAELQRFLELCKANS